MRQDNLKIYRDEKVKRNTELLKRAIEHIKQYSGTISMSNVSKVSYEIAKDNENGLSVPALSKNKLYKALIEEAKNSSDSHKQQAINKELSSKTLKDMSQPELIAEIYKLRVASLSNEKESSVLKDIIAEYKIDKNIVADVRSDEESKECLFALEHAITVLLAQDILYIEQETFDVKLAAFGTLVLKGSVYKKILNKANNNGTNKGKNN